MMRLITVKKYEKKFARDNNNHKIFSHACL